MSTPATVAADARELARLQTLKAYGVLDTAPEEAFDRLTALAADLFGAPIAMVSLIDAGRQWFKSRHGLDAESTPRSQAFCAHAIALEPGDNLVVEDATLDPRFRRNPLVTGAPKVRFYAGALLTAPDGSNLGTLCVIDTKAHLTPGPDDLRRLNVLAAMVVDELELRRATRLLAEKQRLLEMAERMSGVGHWRYQVADGQITWSDEVYRIHGVAQDSFNPNLDSAVAFYHPDDAPKVDALLTEAIRTGKGFEFSLRLNRRDGAQRQVVCKADCILDDQGEVSALMGVFQDVTEQVNALRRVERGQARYKLLADNVADVITRIRLDGSSGYISPAIESLLGYKPVEMMGRPANAFVYGPDQPLILSVFAEMAQGAQERTVQLRAAHKDGYPIWVEVHLKLIFDADGTPSEMIAVIRDIADRKALESEMLRARDAAEANALRAAAAEAMAGLGNWRVDTGGGVVWSPQMYVIYGLSPDEPINLQTLAGMTHPDDVEARAERIYRQFASGEAEDSLTRIVRPDGETRYLEGKSLAERDASGTVVAIVGTMRDVTEQKLADLALAESEERFRRLAVNAPDMIAESDLDGTLSYISPACLAITGFTPEEMVGRNFMSLMDQPEHATRVIDMCQAVFASHGAVAPWSVEFHILRKDGQPIWLECKPTPTLDPVTGRYTGLTDVIRDITARKRMEVELREARAEAEAAAAVKAEFLANMSHELRTPLTSIVGFTGLAAEQVDLSPLTRTYVARVADASQALLCTVNDILDFSKLEAGQVSVDPVPVAMASLTRATLDLFTPQAGAKDLTLTLDDEAQAIALVVAIDPDRIRQILLNLVGNAVKFTASGGVTLRTRYDHLAGVLGVEVIDTGEGISPSKQDALFRRFSQVDGSLTRAHGGTGLGLAICKGLVEAMGGEIGVESAPGAGSRFWFRIPAPLAELAPAMVAATLERPTFAGVRVLVVDDHAANRELARLFLSGVGAEVTEAADGEEAAAAAAELPFDVILMDVRMPRLDGPGALRRIREGDGPNDATPILAFTADADGYASERLLQLGFQGVVAKPVESGVLIAAIARATAFAWDHQLEDLAYAS